MRLLIVIGVVLAVIAFRGGCSGVDIPEEQAVAAARSALAADPQSFTPEQTQTRIFRQGFPPSAIWVVVFTVADPQGGPNDFVHHAAVWVDARSGEVRRVVIDESDDR